MRILVFNWRCWLNPDMGGAEVFTYENAKRWVKAGHEVTLFTSQFPNCKCEEVVDGIRVVRDGGKYSVYWRGKKHFRRQFSKEGYDVVVDEINTRPFLTPKFVSGGQKIVALIHQLAREYWFYETPFPISHMGYYFLEERWLRNYVDVPTVAVSQSTQNDLRAVGLKEVNLVHGGLNFSPLDEVPEKESHPVVVYVGRLNRAKRPGHALKAFSSIKDKIPKTELWVIGDGYLKRDLEKIASDDVKFFGGLSDVDRRELVRRAWVLINPSVREGFGLNVIEANALGVPCVAYNVPGLRDSVRDGETGLLVEPGDMKGLAEGIGEVLEDERLRWRLSENALRYSRNFSWDRTAEQFMEILEAVLGRSGIPEDHE